MGGRSPARFLAPLALVVVAIAFLLVVRNATMEDPADKNAPAKQAQTATPKKKKGRRRYIVRRNDTPSGIAEKTGVTVEELEKLNPGLDPQALTPGTKLKLR